MDLADALIAEHFGQAGGELLVGGVPVGAIAAEHGTPLFVYDAGVFQTKLERLRAAVPPEVDIAFSVKANPNPAVLRYFLAQGCGLEIASGGELTLALHAGAPPARLLFAGPGKTDAELELALRAGVGEIHVESVQEADRLATIGARLGVRAPAAVRVNPTAEAQGGAMRMGGRPAPFGVDEEILDDVVDRLVACPDVDFRGLHLFTGTQILDASVLAAHHAKGLALARRTAERLGRPLATLDFGGGLGVPYVAGEVALDPVKLREGLAAVFADVAGDARLAGTRFVVEPGRYLVAEAGVYVARVTDVKVSREKRFVILDGGMNHHLAASGNLGQVIKRNFPIRALGKLAQPPQGPADVVGPLCTPLDTLARDAQLPALAPGDLVGIFQSGAYGLTASPLLFLGHPTPPEVLVEAGRTRLIRRRGTHADLLAPLP